MNWFEKLTGFGERSPEQVRENLMVVGDTLTSRVNGQVFNCGQLEIPTLAELRRRVREGGDAPGRIALREVLGEARKLHADGENAGALIQVASQFNLLEMTGPGVTPERGVGIYENDHTQGPACAIAAGAGTIYRNYFVTVNGQIGQSATNQIDCLTGIGEALGNAGNRLWEMRNGYALATESGLIEISRFLQAADEEGLDELRQLLRIGVHWNTQVTIGDSRHQVTQAYCSALPVSYSEPPARLWADFARLILEATYEATICSAILNARRTGNNSTYLTLVGGGVFGNDEQWILDAIKRALNLYQHYGLDVAIVSHTASNASIRQLAEQFRH